MWPILLEFAAPLAVQSLFKLMEDDPDENLEEYLEHLQEYIEELEDRVQVLEKKVKALQQAFLTITILAIIGCIFFGVLYFS